MMSAPQWPRLLPPGVVVGLATLGPVGRLPGPGTWGSVAGMAWFIVMYGSANVIFETILTLAVLYLAFAICGEAETRMHKIDPPEVVLDEFASVPVVFLGLGDLLVTGGAWVVMLAGFVLFRLFDIAKPLGIARLQRFSGGFGVVADDVAAALASCAALHLVFRLTPVGNLLGG